MDFTRFLRARKFNQDRALEMLVNYHTCRKDVPDVFHKILEYMWTLYLFRLNAHKIDHISVVHYSLELEINGLCSIEDLDNFSLKVIAKMSTSVMRKMTYITQDAMPVRYKALNIVNEGKIFDLLYGMFKHFFKKKLRERIMVHGKDFTKLHEQVDPQYLPDYLGGYAGDPVEASIKWGEDLCEKQPEDTAL